MLTKRNFLKTLGTMALTGLTPQLWSEINWPENYKEEEDFWKAVRLKYSLPNEYINLENGYYSVMATDVKDSYIKHIHRINKEGSFYMRKRLTEEKKEIVKPLSAMLGCAPENLIITRNTTESLDTIIAGFPWKKGDEAIIATHDYGSMIDMFRQVSERYGVILKQVEIPLNPVSDEEIIHIYKSAISNSTRLILLSHMINITGQILPVRKISDLAHGMDIKVLVDGAHTFAHINFNIEDLNCDFFGCSLHKWLGAPLGSGLLYIATENIPLIYPVYADYDYKNTDITRFNHTGTHPPHTHLAILDAIRFHNYIGKERKENRLRFLKNYWVSKVKGTKNIYMNTPDDPTRSAAIANVGIKGINANNLATLLLEKYKIWSVGIERGTVNGVRITPHIYNTTQELDMLVNALIQLAK